MQIMIELPEDIAVGLSRGGKICLVRCSKAWRSRHIGRASSRLRSFSGCLLSRRGCRSTLSQGARNLRLLGRADFEQDRETLWNFRTREARP